MANTVVSGPSRLDGTTVALAALAVPVTVAAVGVAAVEPFAGIAVPAAVAIAAVTVASPVRAAYLHLGLSPLLAGFGRGSVLPLIRPDEALLALLVLAVAARLLIVGSLGSDHRQPLRYRITNLDRSIAAMAVFSSVVPLLWRASRGYRPLTDDLLYATTLWKYLLIFMLVRLVVTREAHVWMCLKIMLAVGAVVGVVAVAQSVGVPAVTRFLAWLHGEPLAAVANNRGSSTLGTSHGTADLMAFNLGLALALWHWRIGPRPVTAGASVFFGLACLASGQVSAAFALLVVAGTFGLLTGRFGRTLTAAVPATILAGVVLWPVVQARLAGTGTDRIPDSWEARYFNLTNYFWPELFRDGNWLLGVRPAGRLPSYEPWREWVFIESGHTWLLWTGGIPLTLAFAWFTWHGLRASIRLASRTPWYARSEVFRSVGGGRPSVVRPPLIGPAVGLTAAIALSVVFVLMLFDVHLTLRGPAEALFPLVALITVPALWDSGEQWNRFVGGRSWRSRLPTASGRTMAAEAEPAS